MTPTLLEAAYDLIDRGFTVLPANRDKSVALPAWTEYQEISTTKEQISVWYDFQNFSGIGLIAKGFTIIDFDAPGSYDAWIDAKPSLANSFPTVRSGNSYGHRRHVYCDCGVNVIKKLSFGEIRGGKKAFTVCPPSKIGGGYKWIIPLADKIPQIEPSDLPIEAFRHLSSLDQSGEAPTPLGRIAYNSASASITGAPSITGARLYNSCGGELTELGSSLISATLPNHRGDRHHCVLKLARVLKFELRIIDPVELERAVRFWHELALPVIGTKYFSVTWRDFGHAFKNAKYPFLCSGPSRANILSDENPAPHLSALRTDNAKRMASICWNMRGLDGVFYLSSYQAARLIGVKQQSAWAILKKLQNYGYIEKVKRGNRNKIANTYRWIAGDGKTSIG